jgi:hypothetical protein
MTRFEDLPPVDDEGYQADQGRNFLQQTDARISRLRLPNFLAESSKKIQGLGSDLGQMYQGLEQGLSSLPSQAQQASTNFLTSTTGRIAGLGSQLGGAVRSSTDDLTELLDRQREEAARRREEDEERRRIEQEEGERRRERLGRSIGGLFDDLGTGLRSSLDAQRAMDQSVRPSEGPPPTAGQEVGPGGFTLPDTSALTRPSAGGLGGRDPSKPSAFTFGGERLRGFGEGLAGDAGEAERLTGLPGTALRQRLVGGALQGIGDIGRQLGGEADEIAAATPRELGGLRTGGLGDLDLERAGLSTLEAGLGAQDVYGAATYGALKTAGAPEPVAQIASLGANVTAPQSLVDDVAGLLFRGGVAGLRVGRPVVARFIEDTGLDTVRRTMRQGAEAVGSLFDDYLARAAQSPLGAQAGRLATEETGALRLPGRAQAESTPRTPGVPETPGPQLPPSAPLADQADSARARVKAAQQAAAQTPRRGERAPEGSVLATFDSWGSWLREKLTDEATRVAAVQRRITGDLAARGETLAPEADVVTKRRLYAGRAPAYAARVEDELLPAVDGLSPQQAQEVEATLEMLDNADRAKAVQNRVTAQATGEAVGPVAGETALRNTRQSLRMRRARLGEALLKQDQADDAYRQAQAELRRVRAEGRREVRGSQGRGRRRVQRTPEEQAQVEADVQQRLDAARQGTVDARAAAKEAARQANVDLSRVARADLKRMRLEGSTDALRRLEEAALAEDAAQKGAEAAAGRQFSGGVSGDFPEEEIWASARRDVAQRLGPGARPEDVDAEFARHRQAVAGVQAYSRSLRETMHRAGMLSDEVYQRWEREWPNYIRANILQELEQEAATPAAAGAQRFGVNSLTAGGLNLGARMTEEGTTALREQPINALIRMTAAVETIARRNAVAQSLEALVKSDTTGELQRTFRPLKKDESARAGERVFSVYRGGEPVRYAVPERYRALFELDDDASRQGLSLVGKWLGAGALKAGATTYTPGFVALNAMRDAQVYARRAIDRPGETGEALGDLKQAYADLIATGGRGPEDWREALRLGAGQGEGYAGRSPQRVRELLLKEGSLGGRVRVVRSPGEILGAARDALTEAGASPLARIRQGGEIAETAPRLAAYRRALREGASPEQAALAARDITLDFSRGGTAVRSLNKLIPFLNAAVQGQARFVGDWRTRPKQTAIAATTGVLLPTAAAELYNRHFFAEDYADVPSYLKDSGIVVMLPGDVEPERGPGGRRVPGQRNFLYLPLTQDMAILRGAAMRSIEAASGEDPGGAGAVLRSILGNASPVPLEAGFPLPPVARVATELPANRDIFRGRDIVPEYLEERPQEQQALDRTSAFGRVVGGGLSDLGVPGTAPAQIDYAVEGVGGGLGRQLLRGSDVLARGVGLIPGAEGVGDLAGRPYSSAEEFSPLDALRDVPLAGDVVGRVLRSSGGQADQFDADRLAAERTAALRRVDDRLEAMPTFRRLPAAQKQRLRDQEYGKVNRRFAEQAKAMKEQRAGRRVAAQARG